MGMIGRREEVAAVAARGAWVPFSFANDEENGLFLLSKIVRSELQTSLTIGPSSAGPYEQRRRSTQPVARHVSDWLSESSRSDHRSRPALSPLHPPACHPRSAHHRTENLPRPSDWSLPPMSPVPGKPGTLTSPAITTTRDTLLCRLPLRRAPPPPSNLG